MAVINMFWTKSVLLMAFLACHLHFADAQTTLPTASSDVNDFQLTQGQAKGGTCQCSIKTPFPVVCTDYQINNNSEQLRQIQHEINNLTLDITQLYEKATLQSELIITFQDNLAEATEKFNLMEGGQLLITRAEIEGVRQNVRGMASALYTLQQWQGIQTDDEQVQRIRAIMTDVSSISTVVDAMMEFENSDDLDGMQRRITELSGQLRTCNAGQQTGGGAQYSPPTVGTATVSPGTRHGSVGGQALPERWPEMAKQNSCGRLVSVSEPYTVRGSLNQYGVWMRDPEVNPDYVYYHNYTSSSQTVKFGGSMSVGAFQRSKTHWIKGETLQHIKEAIVYNSSLYAYSEERVAYTTTSYDYRGRLRTETNYRTDKKLSKITGGSSPDSNMTIDSDGVVSTRDIASDTPLDRIAYSGPSDVPKMDLSVDESGLWLIYSNELEMLVVSKVDEETLEFERTVESSYPKNSVGNCFIICRKVYCLNGAMRYDSRVAFFMDTDSGFEGFVNVPFIIKYGSLSSIEYNPRDQLLYGWDNGHAVVYSLTFE
ncbi:noelin-like [Asterias amurensis]|uniref:noelin-like n=1 Tax=Asterias amurensis TaxID=7602 RepID=UPI003AB32531